MNGSRISTPLLNFLRPLESPELRHISTSADFYKDGHLGLCESSRAPHRHPNQTNPQVEQRIIQLRKKHPRWGADKFLEDHAK